MGGDNGWFSDNRDDQSSKTDNSSNQNYADQRGVFDGGSAGVTGNNSTLDYFTFKDSHDSTQIKDSFNVTDGGAFKVVDDLVKSTLASNNVATNQAIQAANNSAAAANASSASVGRISESSINAMVDLSKSSTDAMRSNLKDSLNFGENGLTQLLGFGKDVLKLQAHEQEMIGDTQRGVETAYKTAASISSGQENIVKVGLVVAGVVGLVALSAMMKKA